MSIKSPDVTMAEVAKSSGISLSTVSLVLNQKPGIPHETHHAEITAIQSIVHGIHRALMTGNVDPAEVLPKYIADLKASGLDKVLAEVQKQYDAWKAAKGE